MEEFLEGRENEEAYTVFFEHFVPCATMKTSCNRRITTATANGKNQQESLYTISDEAFALLLLENSYDRWLNIFSINQGAVMQRPGIYPMRYQV